MVAAIRRRNSSGAERWRMPYRPKEWNVATQRIGLMRITSRSSFVCPLAAACCQWTIGKRSDDATRRRRPGRPRSFGIERSWDAGAESHLTVPCVRRR